MCRCVVIRWYLIISQFYVWVLSLCLYKTFPIHFVVVYRLALFILLFCTYLFIIKSWSVAVKLWFTNMYFVGFYSLPNLIVIIFIPLYPVFIVGFDCKGCVLERESVKTQASEDRRLLAGVSRLSFPRSEACVLHMTGMRRVCTDKDSCVSRVSRG